MTTSKQIREAYDRGAGVLRMAPIFVPRRFSQAGRRLRLHPTIIMPSVHRADRLKSAGSPPSSRR